MGTTQSPFRPIGQGFGNPWDVSLPGYFLPSNWQLPAKMTTAWDTAILPNQKDGEARRSRIGRPTRKASASVLTSGQEETAKILGTIQRSGFSRTLFPLYSDQVHLGQAYSSETFFLDIDTGNDLSYYRYEAGQYILIYSPNTTEFQIHLIDSINLTLNRLVFIQGINMAMDENTLVYPMLQSRIQLKSKGQLVTDEVMSSTITGEELPGEWALSPASTPGVAPSGFSLYNGDPVLTISPNFNKTTKIKYVRTGKYSQVGVTQIASVYGDRMRQARSFEMSFSSRADFWDLLRLFDSRAGRTYAWWLPSFSNEYEITSFTANGCKVSSFGPVEDWSVRPYISIALEDGTVEIRQISTVSTDNVNDTLVFLEGAFTETNLSNVVRSGFAQHVRFENDELVERWTSDLVVDVSVKAVEVVEEAVITLANLTDIATVGVSSKYAPVDCSFNPVCNTGCFPCGSCWVSGADKVVLSISEVVDDLAKNGMDASFGAYLTQNTPFDIPFTAIRDGYHAFKKTFTQSAGRSITFEIKQDCQLGLWQWEYSIDIGNGEHTFRACGNCTSGGFIPGPDLNCDQNNLGSENSFFTDDCWNTPRIDGGTTESAWNLNDNGQGCTGIVGWQAHTNANFSTTGLVAGKSAIMWGIGGEWDLVEERPCCLTGGTDDVHLPFGGPFSPVDDNLNLTLPCSNGFFMNVNCGSGIPLTSLDCIYQHLGLPLVAGAAVITLNGCDLIISLLGGSTTDCCGGTSPCTAASATMVSNCLYDCGKGGDGNPCTRSNI